MTVDKRSTFSIAPAFDVVDHVRQIGSRSRGFCGPTEIGAESGHSTGDAHREGQHITGFRCDLAQFRMAGIGSGSAPTSQSVHANIARGADISARTRGFSSGS
jgi:hypothetical protein